MNFKTHNDTDIDINMTSLQGHMTVDFQNLVKVFGESKTDLMDKTDAEWTIEFEDGTIASIYNYKTGHNYLGSSGTPVEKIIDWHIGGHNKKAFKLVWNAYKEKMENKDA